MIRLFFHEDETLTRGGILFILVFIVTLCTVAVAFLGAPVAFGVIFGLLALVMFGMIVLTSKTGGI